MKALIFLLTTISTFAVPSKAIHIKSSGVFISDKSGKSTHISSGYLYVDSEFKKLNQTAINKDKRIKKLQATIGKLIDAHELSKAQTESLISIMKQRNAIQNDIKSDLEYKDKLRQDIDHLRGRENRNLRRQNQLEKAKGILMFFLGSKM